LLLAFHRFIFIGLKCKRVCSILRKCIFHLSVFCTFLSYECRYPTRFVYRHFLICLS
jgi:hypothetical protein